MAVISKKNLILQQENVYFQKFVSKNGDEYGLRFGTPKDAKSISMLFREKYEYKYINPLVYEIEYLKKELSNENNFWFVGESLENKEIVCTGLIEKKRYIAHSSKAMTRKKFQGQGVTTKIDAAGLISVTKMPEFKDVLKIYIEVLGLEIRGQKLIKNAGALPFALIPAFNNFGDRRLYKIENNTPFPPEEEEAAFLYSIIFKNLWNIREKKIHLLDNEDFVFFHKFVNSHTKKMNEDELILENGKKYKGYELYGVSKDYFDGIVNLYGCVMEKSLKNLLKTYDKWRIILWRIPTTQNGVQSMALALEKGFNIVGYDIGYKSMSGTLCDSIILAYYPNGGYQVLKVNYLDRNWPLFNKIREIFFSRIN
jgi:hypothetical protein